MSEGGLPIRGLSELTGVAATTLRAWERRYGLLRPGRTPKGHRLYSQADVELVRRVVAQLRQGVSIGDAVRQLRRSGTEAGFPAGAAEAEQWPQFQLRLMRAVELFSYERLDQVYNEALSLYPFELVAERLLLPALHELGELWSQRSAGIGEEHFFSAYLRNKLGARLHHESTRGHGNQLLVACLPGEFHELGALLFSLAARAHGYGVLYLGCDVPVAQLGPVAQRSRCAAIILSGTRRSLDKALLEDFDAYTPSQGPLFFGGQFSTEHGDWIDSLGAVALGEDIGEAIQSLLVSVPPYPLRS